jgi:hypothetical protein
MESPARAADRARLQAPFGYRGCGPAVVAVACRRLMRGHAGMGVRAGRGTRVLRRAVAVYLLFPAMLPGASLWQGTVLCRCPGPAPRRGR